MTVGSGGPHGFHIAQEARLTARELATCDFSFDVSEEAVPPFDGNDIVNVVQVAPYRKAYDSDGELEPADGQFLFAARDAGRVCGYVIVSHAWNHFCQVDDLAVDCGMRRRGLGVQLLDTARAWAAARGLPGMRLETQSNNVPACRLYARYGFQLGGHDRHLYSTLLLPQRETALYWYLFFAGNQCG
ncbi:GNAT family N-acetyltransferase [Massilia sp. METH4]|uniref:GNAT family N-acetyltransferase n=1 Tax=Massilia sp. METH4 TaxID=3123041 RepID=UPI0030D415FC